jgi:hypothetical protein
VPVPYDVPITVNVYLGDSVASYGPYVCPTVTPTVVTDPPPTPATTAPPELPRTGFSVWLVFLVGLGLVDAGALMLLWAARRQR